MQVEFTVSGKPIAKGRPRFTRNGHAYTDEKTAAYETLVRLSYQQQAGQKLQGELIASIEAFFPILKSTSKKSAEEMREGEVGPTKKPDADNIAKAVLDALNGVAYDDDAQVTTLLVKKCYSDEPRVKAQIFEKKGMDKDLYQILINTILRGVSRERRAYGSD